MALLSDPLHQGKSLIMVVSLRFDKLKQNDVFRLSVQLNTRQPTPNVMVYISLEWNHIISLEKL